MPAKAVMEFGTAHYTVISIQTGCVLYSGTSINAAAEVMVPGTVFGKSYAGIEKSEQLAREQRHAQIKHGNTTRAWGE